MTSRDSVGFPGQSLARCAAGPLHWHRPVRQGLSAPHRLRRIFVSSSQRRDSGDVAKSNFDKSQFYGGACRKRAGSFRPQGGCRDRTTIGSGHRAAVASVGARSQTPRPMAPRGGALTRRGGCNRRSVARIPFDYGRALRHGGRDARSGHACRHREWIGQSGHDDSSGNLRLRGCANAGSSRKTRWTPPQARTTRRPPRSMWTSPRLSSTRAC